MAKEKLPRVTEADVRGLASEKSFERGESYYKDGAIMDPVRQGTQLRTYCEGSEYEPYHLSVTLAKGGVEDASCTCPYDWGGICKHLVALLLTYVHKPDLFRVVPPLKEMLAQSTREELIAIINQMIRCEPELMSIVELSTAIQQGQEGKSVNVATYQRQAQQALRHDSPRFIEKELQTLCDAAASLAEGGDLLNAGAVYHVLLEEAVNRYNDEMLSMDEDGDIAVIVDELAQGLIECIRNSDADENTRRTWFQSLLEAELADIELGGIDLAPSVRDAILELATDEEWAWIERRVNDKLAKSQGWARKELESFLGQRVRKTRRRK
ncbi:MAG TPA: SWIM zinc finger family protein [Blastocatellia bacterium]|nr:SWIM zinc finger family protein [Blastocatellia bacterium]